MSFLRINEEYIRSAAQADAYRTEPPFKLQGSYRNMNRLAEKVSPVMNDAELEELISTYYRNEAQTLTTGTEANLLKFKELTGEITPVEAARWEEIKKTFRKNQILGGMGEDDPVGRVVAKLGAFYDGLEKIKEVLETAIRTRDGDDRPLIIITPPASAVTATDVRRNVPSDWKNEVAITQETLRKIWDLIDADKPKADGSS
jgi:hypothetical protein